MSMKAEVLREVAKDQELLWNIGRKAVEDVLIDYRDSQISVLNRNNGLVCKEKDGEPSSTIRLGIEGALRVALLAIADHLDSQSKINLNMQGVTSGRISTKEEGKT